MPLQLHHIFVLASAGAPEAKGLLDAGLIEGSPNTHSGQGTANRRFFFENGFLELLWVHDEREAQSPLTAPTRLWERWAGRGRTASPFGLCFASEEGADPELPFPTWAYRPTYLPEGRSILFADRMPLSEPEVFVRDWPQALASRTTEPTNHPAGLVEMRSVSAGLPNPASISTTLRAIEDAGLVEIHRSDTPELVVEFTSKKEVRLAIPGLGLTVVGHVPAGQTAGIEIVAATSAGQMEVVRELLHEYQSSVGVDLCFQGFDAEVRGLPGQYSPPRGRLLLALHEGKAVGCVALRELDSRRCEMKRLFVRPSHRSTGTGRLLVAAILAGAREIGYAEIVLDTLPLMAEAQRLYEKLGFRDIPAYCENPVAGTRYLGKSLNELPPGGSTGNPQ